MKRPTAIVGLVAAIAVIAFSWHRASQGPSGDPVRPTKSRGGSALRWTGGASRDLAPAARVDPDVAIAGRVVDAVDGHAIEGAIVTLRSREGDELDATVTDDTGAFSFDDAGSAEVVAASADGYGIHAKEIGRETEAIVLELDGAVTVTGEVVSPSGDPVAGAEVWVEDYERIWRDPPVVSSSVRTGADGRFVIRDAPSGTLIARAAHPRFAKAETRVGGVAAGRTRENVRIALGETGSLEGRVTTEDGAAASGATVRWYTFGADRWRDVDVAATMTAADDGRFRFDHLPEGRGYVRATTESGEGAVAVTIEVGRDASADVVVEEEAVFAGVVVDVEGNPVAGARVAVDPSSAELDLDAAEDEGDAADRRRRMNFFLRSPRVRDWGTTSGADGTFRFHAPVRGEVTLHANATRAAGSVSAKPGATSLRIVVEALATARVRVVGSDGRPWALPVTVFFQGPTRGSELVTGEAALDVEPGDYRFFTREAPDARVETRIAAGPEVAVVTIAVGARDAARIRGRVVGPDGNAAAGARVSIAGAGNRDWGGAQGARLDWDSTVRSDSQGRFALEAPAGERKLFVYHPEMRAEVVPVTVPAQGEVDAGVIRLQAGEGASAIFEFSGIGAVLRLDEQTRCAVLDVVKDGPAERAGIRKGDVFLEVDGTPLHGMELGDVIERIRGPVGTTVSLLVEREGNLQPLVFDVVREKIRA